jgi:predicted lactoylglutathione lyase
MANQIFVNLPVKDLNRSIEYYKQLGYSFNPQFTDENATCMLVGENIFAMLLNHKRFSDFTEKPIADAHKTIQVMIALSLNSNAEVDSIMEKGIKAGGKEPRPVQDLGFMYNRALEDIDGHTWEYFFMDMSKFPQQ